MKQLPALVLLAALLLALPAVSMETGGKKHIGIADGPGIWINIWNYPEQNVDRYCGWLAGHRIRNCFVQTSRSNTDAIAHPDKLGILIDACHHYDIHVIAWSFADLSNPEADSQKLIAAAQFASPEGGRLDAVAADLENNLTPARVENFSRNLRAALGPTYPLVAVVYSPLNRAAAVARTPWKLIASYFDIVAPMTYWSGKGQNLDAYTYTALTINQVRRLSGSSEIEIHPIGDGMYSRNSEIEAFLKACRDNEATCVSLYPNQKVKDAQLAVLERYGSYFQPNSRFRFAAYRELRASGVMPAPPGLNPSASIPRGEFLQLLVAELSQKSAVTPEEAYRYLAARKVVPELRDQGTFLSYQASPLTQAEALSIVAALMRGDNHGKPHRSWFMQSARASEGAIGAQPGARPVNYLDAAQIILESRAGLHFPCKEGST